MPHEIDIEQLTREAGSDSDHSKPFGWAHHTRREKIRQRLLAEGYADDHTLIFAVSRAETEAARDRLTFRQKQDLARWIGLKWVARQMPHAAAPVGASDEFTADELAFLVEKLAGVNDPRGLSALKRAEFLLSRLPQN